MTCYRTKRHGLVSLLERFQTSESEKVSKRYLELDRPHNGSIKMSSPIWKLLIASSLILVGSLLPCEVARIQFTESPYRIVNISQTSTEIPPQNGLIQPSWSFEISNEHCPAHSEPHRDHNLPRALRSAIQPLPLSGSWPWKNDHQNTTKNMETNFEKAVPVC